ncbi:MAG: dependent oxidoreductase [Caulobacteraceae bacterium]|nr:dependent oxidoreductase [Caulobacteraceae bacterium]
MAAGGTGRDEMYDVIIVGGGHNGLVAGAYLAKAGRKVLVVERAAAAGGFAQSAPVIPEAPDHLVNTGTGHLLSLHGSKVVGELELARHGLKTIPDDPMYAYLAPDGATVAMFRDVRRTADDFAQGSKADGQAYLEFMELIGALMEFGAVVAAGEPGVRGPRFYVDFAKVAIRNRRLKAKLELIRSAPADQLAMEWFEHPHNQALMLGVVAGIGPFDVDGNGLAYGAFGLYHFLGASNPVGGMRAVAGAFLGAYREAGGELMTGAQVAEIVIADGACRGVRLADGKVIEARAVIGACAPQIVAQLATPGGLDRVTQTRLDYAPANRWNIGPSLMNVASRRAITVKARHRRADGVSLDETVGLIGTAAELQAGLAQARRGMVPETPVFSVLPLCDPRLEVAPAGQGLAYIYMPVFPVELNDGWGNQKAPAGDAIVRRAAEHYDGFDAELGRWFETPPEREARTGSPNGIASQVDFGAFRMGANRPAFGLGGAKPLASGLFLGGAGSAPGGGVSGNPGRLAASRVGAFLDRGR